MPLTIKRFCSGGRPRPRFSGSIGSKPFRTRHSTSVRSPLLKSAPKKAALNQPPRFASISLCVSFCSPIAKPALWGNKFIHDSRANRRNYAEGIDTETGADGASDLLVPVCFRLVHPETRIPSGVPPGLHRMGDLLVRMRSPVLRRAIRNGRSPQVGIQPAPNLSTPPSTTLAELQDVQLPGILRNEGNGAAARAISGQG